MGNKTKGISNVSGNNSSNNNTNKANSMKIIVMESVSLPIKHHGYK